MPKAKSAATSPWPTGRQGAVSLTFDDGLASQLDVAVPMVEGSGLRATFYLILGGRDWAPRLEPWRRVAESGHELGSHTLAHRCSRAYFDTRDVPCLETMTLDEMSEEIDEAERRLELLAPGRPRSFCYPCYATELGEGATRTSYVPLVAGRYLAARGRGDQANHPLTCDLHYLWSWPAERMSGAQLVEMVEGAASTGKWVILTFHGIDQGHLSVSDVDLQELLGHLALRADTIWTAPVVAVAQAVARWRGQFSALPTGDQ